MQTRDFTWSLGSICVHPLQCVGRYWPANSAEAATLLINVKLEDFKDSLKFIELLKEATLENGGLTKEQLTCLHNSVQEKFIIDDPVVCLSIVLFTLENTLQEYYNAVRDATIMYSLDHQVLTLYKVLHIHGSCMCPHPVCDLDTIVHQEGYGPT